MRRKIAKKFERLILLLLSSGIRTASGKEESLQNPELKDIEYPTVTDARSSQFSNLTPSLRDAEAGYDINVAGVRMTSGRRRIRDRVHAEFIIFTKRPGKEDVYMARRYGAFKKL